MTEVLHHTGGFQDQPIFNTVIEIHYKGRLWPNVWMDSDANTYYHVSIGQTTSPTC